MAEKLAFVKQFLPVRCGKIGRLLWCVTIGGTDELGDCFRPVGAFDNSPAVYCWDAKHRHFVQQVP